MNKLFALEVKGEIVGLLKQNELGYMDFVRICEEIKEKKGTNDVYTVKATLIEEYGFEDTMLMGGCEVSKRKGVL